MGCCWEEDEQLLTETLVETSISEDSVNYAVISPMNSNFRALISCRDVLRSILERLHPRDLARAACVCRLWFAVASEREVQERAFRASWKVRRILGEPSSPGFWRHPSLGRFALSHKLDRGDSVAGLALKYSVQVMDIKRLNNMMSDHGIHSRDRILIPINNPALLHDSTCFIEIDAYAKREVAVLHPNGRPDDGKLNRASSRLITEAGKRKILESVKRSMQVDDGTAEYYLSVADGDPRAAMLEFTEDVNWERNRDHQS